MISIVKKMKLIIPEKKTLTCNLRLNNIQLGNLSL